MIKVKKAFKEYSYKNAPEMPFEFEVENTYNRDVFVFVKSACGCSKAGAYIKNKSLTKLLIPYSLTSVIPAKEPFTVKGFLKKRNKAGDYSKTLTINIYGLSAQGKKGKLIQKEELLFKITVKD